MLSKEQAKEKLRELVNKFYAKEKEYKSLSEADIETKLIRELFVEILGWTNDDFFQQTRVSRGDKRGRADYEFKLGDKRVFFLEVKKVGVPLDKEADEQVVSYALSKKNVSFAISTNFKQLKVFCVEEENAMNNVFRIFTEPEEYISKFEDLWLLSKESFQNNLLLKQAEKEQRLKKRVSIDKYLLEDFMYIRKIISNDIEKRYSNKYSPNEKDEIVQRILDRLIFIRRCEDVGINPNEAMLNDLTNNSDERASSKLKEIFKLYDDKYNSGLFTIGEDNDCDKITISGKIIKNLIELLYKSRDKKYYYNFDWIDADVLGQVYEQYLGKILQQTKSGKAKLKEGQAHRKEQGIYYTPTYIVDYIIKNTLGEIIKEKRDIKNLKILDPACGSGSFLIKAFDYMYNELSKEQESQKKLKFDKQGFYSFKTEILKNNLFGVDLDHKAVEITKLNLLLKAAEKNRKLPEELDLHIRKGNSLIDDEAISKDYFKWQGDFQEGTFDVVIGNPPYVEARQIEQNYVDFYRNFYRTAGNRVNTFPLFVEKSINLLKEKGLFGMIIHKNSIRSNDYEKLRKFILDRCKILKVVPLGAGVFEGVTGEMVILIFQKCEDQNSRKKNIVLHGDRETILKNKFYNKLSQKIFYEIPGNRFNVYLNEQKIKILEKIKNNTSELRDVADTKQGIIVGDEKKYIKSSKESNKYVPILRGRNISRYNIKFNNEYLFYVPGTKVLTRGKTPDLFEKDEKILTQHVSGRIIACLDTSSYYVLQTINLVYSKGEISNKYLLGLLNSKLLNFYYDSYFNMGSEFTTAVATENLDLLPIKKIPESQQQKIISLVDRILEKNKQLVSFGDKQTSETKKLKDEIEQIDKEINEEVYKLYELTPEEIKIIEESLK